MEALLGDLPEGVDGDELRSQANNLWKMMDDMAETDPQAYRAFIDKQMKDHKEASKPPQPHMCVRTSVPASKCPFYINVMQYHRIPKPQSDQDPIPCMGGDIYDIEDNRAKAVAIAFNPEVTEMFGIDSNLMAEQKLLINLAIDYVEDHQKVKLSRNYVLLPKDTVVKGPAKQAVRTLMKRYGGNVDMEEQMEEMEKRFKQQSNNGSLIDQLANISVGNASTGKVETKEPKIKLNVGTDDNKAVKKTLIEEVSSTNVQLPTPEYCLDSKDLDGGKSLVLRVKLPGVTTVADCELDTSANDVHLLVPDLYDLQVKLPEKVDESLAKARFSKKSATLTLTLPVL